MTLLRTKEAAEFLRYTNPKSLYNNKAIPRHTREGRVWYVKEELEEWVLGDSADSPPSSPKTTRPKYRIKVRR